ncbi:MAG: hypothetical protein CL504_02125 [Actinobacteria bacterium]|nr:hypothetical protein [Actinomycetota bacterium]
MSIAALQKHLGRRMWAPPSNGIATDIQVPVDVIDVRQVFDRVDCLITTGHGERWVGETSLNNLPEQMNELPS